MLIYGSNSSHLKTAQSQTATCPECGTKGSLAFSVFSKHAHIFWIPLFPMGKAGGSQCQHCKHALSNKEMPDDLKREYNNLKAETKTPVWKFSGLALIAILVVAVAYSSGESEKRNKAYIAAPAAGDVYEYKAEGDYSSMKVVRVDNDSVYVQLNEYVTNKRTGVYKIDKAENYMNFEMGISRNDLQAQFADGTIYDVNRD